MMIWVLLGLIVLNGLLAMAEMALLEARPARLHKLAEQGQHGAKIALTLIDQPARLISTIQIGMVSILMCVAILAHLQFAASLSHYLSVYSNLPSSLTDLCSTVLIVVLASYFSLVFGVLTPKQLGQYAAESIACLVSRPIYWLSLISKPMIDLLGFSTRITLKMLWIKPQAEPSVTQEEFHAMLEEGTESGLIDAQEHQMLRNVFRLEDRKIASLMVPRLDISWLSLHDPIELTLKKIAASRYSRFPVCRDSINDVVGLVSAKAVLAQALNKHFDSLEPLLSEPLYVPDSLNAMDLLNTLRQSKTEMAFVVDEYGDLQGIVTSQDLLEAITGDFLPIDENDVWATAQADGSWLIDGLIPNEILKDLLHIEQLPEEYTDTYNTLSGLMMLQLGRIPQTGDVMSCAEWQFEIITMQGKRIDKIHATPCLATFALPMPNPDQNPT